ncbi:MAG: DUF4411 family protein [Nitrospira sp.]|nr:DUF4411 family protein [Nitrospira sp.]
MDLFPGYCIDTNALIDLWRRRYAPDVFRSLWKNLENLISQGRLIAPREVLNELEKYGDKNDELLKWVKQHKEMFKDLDDDQLNQVRDILKHFPTLVDTNKTTPEADPFVIALAMSKGWMVITSEQPANLTANPSARPKIPNVCEHFNTKCIYELLEFFREEKWVF